MQSEIKKKQLKLFEELTKIENSIKGANIYKEFTGETKLLPNQFSTPLRRIISKRRETNNIEKFYYRYNEDIKKLENIIQRKKLDKIQNKLIGFKWFTTLKDTTIAIAIVIVIGILGFELWNKELNYQTLTKLFIIDFVCCILFQLNFFIELKLSKSKSWYLKNHWIDFITSIPIPSFELIRTGRTVRLFRLIKILRIFRIFRLISYTWKGMHTLSEIFDVKMMKRTFFISILLIIFGAFAINYIEFNNSYSIDEIHKTIWWSFNALVTGGFTDIYNPNSLLGMLLTSLLVLIGMILISVFTATLTSIMVGDNSVESADSLKLYLEKRINNIEKKLDNLI